MIVWIVFRKEVRRVTIVTLFDTRQAAVGYLEAVAASLGQPFGGGFEGSYVVGSQEYYIERHRVNITNRIGVK